MPKVNGHPNNKKSQPRASSSRASSKGGSEASQTDFSDKQQEAEKNKVVHDCVYYLLVAGGRKYPIKRADIMKNVPQMQEFKRQFNVIMTDAQKVMKKTFGIMLMKLSQKNDAFILVNSDRDNKIDDFHGVDLFSRGLLVFILTVIWMNEGSIREEQLWKTLKVLGIDHEAKKAHPVFGDVRKYVTQELVKQMYITYQKTNSELSLFEFAWGIRANYEVDKEEMLDFVCQVYKTQPKDWIVQFQEIAREREAE